LGTNADVVAAGSGHPINEGPKKGGGGKGNWGRWVSKQPAECALPVGHVAERIQPQCGVCILNAVWAS
jgi:hypothetical protein